MKTDQGARWFGYCRVSTEAQAVNGTSLEDQQRKVAAVAGYHGAKIHTMFVEQGVSGAVALGQRPEGFKLMAGAKAGDVVVVSKLDRAFRSTIDALGVIERFRLRGVQIILADISVEPLTQDGVGRLFFSIMASLAEFERERLRERTMAGKRRKAEAGGYVGGGIPPEMRIRMGDAGEKIVEVDPANLPVLEFAVRVRATGASLRDLEEIVKEQFPDHALAQEMGFTDWHRYFKRRKIEKPVAPKPRPKGRQREAKRAKKYVTPLMMMREQQW